MILVKDKVLKGKYRFKMERNGSVVIEKKAKPKIDEETGEVRERWRFLKHKMTLDAALKDVVLQDMCDEHLEFDSVKAYVEEMENRLKKLREYFIT